MTFQELIAKHTLNNAQFIQHMGTLERAVGQVSYVWSGDLRNPYLHTNICLAQDAGILTTEYTESEQESGYYVKWADDAKAKIESLSNEAKAQ